LNNAGLPEESPQLSEPTPMDDIPVAVREITENPKQNQWKPAILLGGVVVGLGAIAFLIGGLLGKPAPEPSVSQSPAISQPEASPTPANTLLGHFAYSEAPASELQTIPGERGYQLRKAAAKKYRQMVTAARGEGINLVTISAFRSIADQKHLFFDVKAERGQDARERAEVSAPPGYSEHHTGYALDIGDGNLPATNLNPKFEKTAAFKWLQKNAARFSFEMSFPRNNPQGVNYEPWHWRFVGDQQSLETFYKAKNLSSSRPAK
jgi:D-alanyl-D-alanine carboxypeptidase